MSTIEQGQKTKKKMLNIGCYSCIRGGQMKMGLERWSHGGSTKSVEGRSGKTGNATPPFPVLQRDEEEEDQIPWLLVNRESVNPVVRAVSRGSGRGWYRMRCPPRMPHLCGAWWYRDEKQNNLVEHWPDRVLKKPQMPCITQKGVRHG